MLFYDKFTVYFWTAFDVIKIIRNIVVRPKLDAKCAKYDGGIKKTIWQRLILALAKSMNPSNPIKYINI